jgi:hypothetical protein
MRHEAQLRSDPETKSRCSVPAKTARSRAGRDQLVGAPQIGDDGLTHRTVDAFVLDNLDVGARRTV